jgi:predicted TIM-barrel fold metal-dependent hydrolase
LKKGGAIDVHAHFLPPVYLAELSDLGVKLLDGIVSIPDWSPERALGLMDETGIAGAILSISSPFVSFARPERRPLLCRAINDAAAELTARYPARFGGYAILPLPDITASLLELDYALDGLRLDGVSLPTNVHGRYLGDPELEPLLEALNTRGCTVFVHPTTPSCFKQIGLALPPPMIEFPFDTTRTIVNLLFSGALARHDNIRFIFPHAGGTLPYLVQRIATVGGLPYMGSRTLDPAEILHALEGLHYDLALSANPVQVQALRALVPMTQILYGTDFPFAPEAAVRTAAEGFRRLNLSDDERFMIKRGNAGRLFASFGNRCCRPEGVANT